MSQQKSSATFMGAALYFSIATLFGILPTYAHNAFAQEAENMPKAVGPLGPVDVKNEIADRPAPVENNKQIDVPKKEIIDKSVNATAPTLAPSLSSDIPAAKRVSKAPAKSNSSAKDQSDNKNNNAETVSGNDDNDGNKIEAAESGKTNGVDNVISANDETKNNDIITPKNDVERKYFSQFSLGTNIWIWGALFILLLGSIAVIYQFYKKQKLKRAAANHENISDKNNSEIETGAAIIAEQEPPIGPANPPSMGQRPWLNAHFHPQNAMLTLTSLRVKGEITIENHGDLASDAAILHLLLAQADEGHQLILDAFHRSHDAQTVNGNVGEHETDVHPKLGEKYDIAAINAGGNFVQQVELTLPITALKPMEYGEQKFIIPMLAVDLRYYWPDCDIEKGEAGFANFANIIGKESTPPNAKMAPLRIDKGPCNYGTLGQRAISTPQSY